MTRRGKVGAGRKAVTFGLNMSRYLTGVDFCHQQSHTTFMVAVSTFVVVADGIGRRWSRTR